VITLSARTLHGYVGSSELFSLLKHARTEIGSFDRRWERSVAFAKFLVNEASGTGYASEKSQAAELYLPRRPLFRVLV
jgi:hypothetical protein